MTSSEACVTREREFDRAVSAALRESVRDAEPAPQARAALLRAATGQIAQANLLEAHPERRRPSARPPARSHDGAQSELEARIGTDVLQVQMFGRRLVV